VKASSKTDRRKPEMKLEAKGRPLTARDVAELCGVELKTVHNWVAEGRLPHFRTPGRHLRFQPHLVQSFLQEIGYGPSVERRTAVIWVPAAKVTRLRRALSHYDCRSVSDVWSALIVAGKEDPDAMVVDATFLTLPDFRGLMNAVRLNLPGTTMILVGEPTPGAGRGVVAVRWDDLGSLTRVLDRD
jgi:excisionase family DNA binding protein